MATADYWSAADLDALATGGHIGEEVLRKIWDISEIPLPFTEAIGEGAPIKATPHSWLIDSNFAIDVANKLVDGADATGNQAAGGTRVQNHAQISDNVIEVTERADASDTLGRAEESAYQIHKAQRSLRRDQEAISLELQASVADDGDSAAGQSAGFPAWLTTNKDLGAAPGATAGYQSGTGLVTIAVAGDARVLTIAELRALVQSVYLQNGNPTVLMTRPEVVAGLNKYIMANPTAYGIATPTANVSGEGGGVNMTAQGFINVLVTDFGTTLKVVPNRLQQVHDSGDATPEDVCDLFLIDTGMVEFTTLIPEHVEPLAKLGTSKRSQISKQWSLRVMNEAAHAKISDIQPAGAVAA